MGSSPPLSLTLRWRHRAQRVFAPQHRAFWLMVLNGVLFQLSQALADPRRVVAAFLTQLGGHAWVVGLAVAIGPTSAILPQLYASHLVADGRRRMPYYVYGAAIRWVGLMVIIVALLTMGRRPALLMVVFLGAFTITGAGIGLTIVAFGDILTRTVAPQRRGRLFALRLALGGLLAVAAGGVVSHVLSPDFWLPFPHNVALLFALSLVLLVLAQRSFMKVDEPDLAPRERPAGSFGNFLRQAVALLFRDPDLLRYALYRNMTPLAWMPLAFLVPYAMKDLGYDAGVAGWFLSTGMVAMALSNVFWAKASDNLGNRLVIRLSSVALLLAVAAMVPIPALLGAWGAGSRALLGWLLLLGAVGEIGLAGLQIGRTNYLFELAPQHDVSLYVAITNTAAAPMILVAAPLTGWLATRYGYAVVCVLGLVAGVGSLVATLLLNEPRHRLGGALR